MYSFTDLCQAFVFGAVLAFMAFWLPGLAAAVAEDWRTFKAERAATRADRAQRNHTN